MVMESRCEIKFDEKIKDLNSKLLECYKFPLLNFAFIISDVLAENSVFSSKFYFGRSIKSIRKGTNELKELRSRILGTLEEYFLNYEPTLIADAFKERSDEVRKNFIIENFYLKPFLQKLDNYIQKSESILNIRKSHPAANISFWPLFKEGRKQDLAKNNQIAFLWAQTIRKGGVHWRNICNLFAWFLEFLDESNYAEYLHFKRKRKDEDWREYEEYEKEEGISPNYEVLKARYSQIKKTYRYLLHSTSKVLYFSKKNGKHERPLCFANSVVSVEFYKDKIRTIYKMDDKLGVRDVTFQRSGFKQEIKEYDKEDSKKEKNWLLLKIK